MIFLEFFVQGSGKLNTAGPPCQAISGQKAGCPKKRLDNFFGAHTLKKKIKEAYMSHEKEGLPG